ncbi:uncharacterized protein LOC134835585 [Culicoides brevitarsis]|uniref:uncharacterized protein LOC134835585 n=1 Tax=Culicoides brevitarsis TaxID=469753 RepID=UPI00307CAD03
METVIKDGQIASDDAKFDEESSSTQFPFDESFDVPSSAGDENNQGAPQKNQLTPRRDEDDDTSDEELHFAGVGSSSCTLFNPLFTSSVSSSSLQQSRDLERSVSTSDDNPRDNHLNNNNKKPLCEIGRSYSVAQDSRTEKQRAAMLEQLRHRRQLLRDSSFQSDSSHASHCSSIECLLDSRKSDPEAILTNLGFKSPKTEDILSKIPKRFLQPSKVRGVNTEEFLQKQQLAKHLHDTSVLGYRGLIGNPDIAPSSIVAKIMERFQINDSSRLKAEYLLNNNLSHLQRFQDRPRSAPPNHPPSFADIATTVVQNIPKKNPLIVNKYK